jgi:hypothetical protein
MKNKTIGIFVISLFFIMLFIPTTTSLKIDENIEQNIEKNEGTLVYSKLFAGCAGTRVGLISRVEIKSISYLNKIDDVYYNVELTGEIKERSLYFHRNRIILSTVAPLLDLFLKNFDDYVITSGTTFTLKALKWDFGDMASNTEDIQEGSIIGDFSGTGVLVKIYEL